MPLKGDGARNRLGGSCASAEIFGDRLRGLDRDIAEPLSGHFRRVKADRGKASVRPKNDTVARNEEDRLRQPVDDFEKCVEGHGQPIL